MDLKGWTLRDKNQNSPGVVLDAKLAPGQSLVLTATVDLDPVKLPNDGGLLVLLNAAGEQVDRID